MSVTPVQASTRSHRPRRWWGLVVAASCAYILALLALYLLPSLLSNSAMGWLTLDMVLVAVAAFAAFRDIAVARERRPLHKGEARAVAAAVAVVLLWAGGLVFLATPAGSDLGVLAVFIVIPIIPVVTLALVGTIIYRRSSTS